MVRDAIVRRAIDAIEDFDKRTDSDTETGFLPHLAYDRSLERLAELDCAAGQTPFALERRVCSLHEEDSIAVKNHGTDANDRLRREISHVPITFTTTRFFRWPSNSA